MIRSTIHSALLLTGLILFSGDLFAQQRFEVNSGFLFESYHFDSGLEFTGVSQFSLPITMTTGIGRLGSLTLSSGFTRIQMDGSEDPQQVDRSLSGIVDTEARLVVNLFPERLSLLVTAVAPTGIESIELEEGPILTALSSQVIGFSTSSLGTGGAAGVGVAAALPMGQMALGVGGSYTRAMAYSPVLNQPEEWKPGDEIRLRAGLEGTVAPQTYLRIASVFASRKKDLLDDEEKGGIGNRIHGYVALNQGLGTASMTLYAFDSYRSAPQIESTAVGAVVIPKGNLLALGAKFAIPVGRETRLMPRVEYRRLTEASKEGLGDGSLESAGSTVRLGADLRQPISSRFAVVLEANGLFGNLISLDGQDVGTSGFRGGIHLQIR